MIAASPGATDAELLRLLRAGRGWDEFLAAHADYLYTAVVAHLRRKYHSLDPDDAGEVFVLTLEKLRADRMRRLRDFGGRSALRTWLVAVMRNLAIDYYRDQEHLRRTGFKAAAALPPEEREMFQLHFLEGWDAPAIAGRLECPPAAVADGLRRIAEALGPVKVARLAGEQARRAGPVPLDEPGGEGDANARVATLPDGGPDPEALLLAREARDEERRGRQRFCVYLRERRVLTPDEETLLEAVAGGGGDHPPVLPDAGARARCRALAVRIRAYAVAAELREELYRGCVAYLCAAAADEEAGSEKPAV